MLAWGQGRKQEPVANRNAVLFRPRDARIEEAAQRGISREPEQRGSGSVGRQVGQRDAVNLGKQIREIR
jgi:hypothetical protein